MLHLPVFRYVDDYFGAEREETIEQAMQLLARLVRMLLGDSAIAERKLECGTFLTVLGIKVSPSAKGVRFELDPAKRTKWLEQIEQALASGHLDAGSSTKLAGRLSWSTQHLFKKVYVLRVCFACAVRVRPLFFVRWVEP